MGGVGLTVCSDCAARTESPNCASNPGVVLPQATNNKLKIAALHVLMRDGCH
jgi:hypothetical protein